MQPFGRLIVHDRVLLADLIGPSFDDGNAFGDRLLPYHLVSGTSPDRQETQNQNGEYHLVEQT